jgi:hypothetical protein
VGMIAKLSRHTFLIRSTNGADVCLQRARGALSDATMSCAAVAHLHAAPEIYFVPSIDLFIPGNAKAQERDNKIIQSNGRCRRTMRRQSWKPIKVAAQFFELVGVMPRSSRGGGI